MQYQIVVIPEAENDIQEAFVWYEEKRIGLGCDFLLQIDAGINFISKNPKIHPSEYKGARKHIIKRFPYKIIYMIEKEKIIVLAVIHNRRKANLIEKRVKNQ
jgi:plasmid stabilization system protein ParE